jgi:hypothetical protein
VIDLDPRGRSVLVTAETVGAIRERGDEPTPWPLT